MKYLLIIFFIFGTYFSSSIFSKDLRQQINSIKELSNEDFPFLFNVDESGKKEFSDILFSWNTTITQKINLLDSWVMKQSDEVKRDYEDWKSEAMEFINVVKTLHEKKTANSSMEAKQVDQKFIEIWEDENLTPQQKCQQFMNLYNFAMEEVRNQAKLKAPSNFNCSEPSNPVMKTSRITDD